MEEGKERMTGDRGLDKQRMVAEMDAACLDRNILDPWQGDIGQ